ncbi:MAG: Tfp pilus assembly protein FimT/FimU [Candidatus Dojkabacteria bacterium]
MKKAFTLLEAIIAMGIMAVLLGFSTYALVQVKATIELQNSYSDIISALQTTQNRARNSVTKPGSSTTVPDYITVAFQPTTYNFQTCVKNGSRVTCTDDTASAKPSEILNVQIQPSNGCNTIGFARLTSDLVTVDSNGALNSTGSCTITIVHSSTGNSRVISIDLSSNNINTN